MKNSIGSLAALATLAAPALVEAAPQAAAFSNVALPFFEYINVDIDNDGTDDFSVYNNDGFVAFEASGLTLFTGNFVNVGDTLAATGDADAYYSSFSSSGYVGVSFVTGGNTHAGWLYLDYTDTQAPVLAGGAWETTAGESIVVGAIPEPSTVAALAGAGALLGALAWRRRSSTGTPAGTDTAS